MRDAGRGWPAAPAAAAAGPVGANTQRRSNRKRDRVAVRFAATSTASSTGRAGASVTACSPTSAPLVRPSPSANTSNPCTWCRAACRRPVTPKVSRRLAAVLPTAVTASATRFDACAPAPPPRSMRNSARYASVLMIPTPANRASWPVSPGGVRPSRSRRCPIGSRPVARSRLSRAMPCRSASTVAAMSTRLSGSSTQSTGTSWIRSPARCASTSSSVSKNHPVSCTSGSSRCATSRRIALNPHWASENRAASAPRSSRL